MLQQQSKIEWTRINNDTNGNPRYVCHFTELLKPNTDFKLLYGLTEKEQAQYQEGMSKTLFAYKIACKRANKIGGRKYSTKQYGGGIVFKSYNIIDTEKQIFDLLK